METLFTITVIALVILPIILFGDHKEELFYDFDENKTYYSFRGSFSVNADADCLMRVIFDFEHISKYAMGATSMRVIQRGEEWYDITYIYRKMLIFENKSTWRRTLKRGENKVVFKMLSSENSLEIMPDTNSSSGFYQIKAENGGHRVEYFQECTLDAGFLNKSFKRQAKKNAIMFLGEFKKYIENTCN